MVGTAVKNTRKYMFHYLNEKTETSNFELFFQVEKEPLFSYPVTAHGSVINIKGRDSSD